MRQFIKRALQKANEPGGDVSGLKISRDFILAASREIELLETVLDSLPRGILVCDTGHNLILANKAVRRYLSIVSYEQGNESVWAVIPEQEVADFLFSVLLSGDSADEREFNVEINNMARLLSVSIMPLVQDHRVSGSLILVDDITERRSREARMRQMENLASLTTLAAGVAHEIKNPLAALSLHVQLIKKTMDAAADNLPDTDSVNCLPLVDKYLKVVNEEVERLNSIVVDFLFAVRPMNAELRTGNINTFIMELAEFVSLELEEARIECVLDLAEDLPEVSFDGRLMKQALLNLIQNAEAAMSGGGKLLVSTVVREGEIEIVVADTGTGIPEEDIPKIFEPYFTTKETGSGLGLTMVFKIIKEHQGEISVKSREGEGTAFIITLPIPQTERHLITFSGEQKK